MQNFEANDVATCMRKSGSWKMEKFIIYILLHKHNARQRQNKLYTARFITSKNESKKADWKNE